MLMRRIEIRGLPARRKTRGPKLAVITSLDLVRRDFARTAPDQLWLTDTTEHPTREGKLYCCAVLDAFSRMIVGWAIDRVQETKLVINALPRFNPSMQHSSDSQSKEGLAMADSRHRYSAESRRELWRRWLVRSIIELALACVWRRHLRRVAQSI